MPLTPVPPVIPLAEAAAAAFPRLDLTADEARRLAQGARLPLPSQDAGAPATPGTGGQDRPAVPLAAFDPDGTLIALVTPEGDRLRSLAVFVDAAVKTRDT
jgi:tRNA pseudouridine55 synthase